MRMVFSLAAVLVAHLVVLLFPLDADARRGRRVQIDFNETWTNEEGVDFSQSENSDALNFVDSDGDGVADDGSELPLRLNVGGVFYDRLWINENGFVSFGSSDPAGPTSATDFDVAVASIEEIPGFVLAPFYADLEARMPTPGCPQSTSLAEPCDVSFSILNISDEDFDFEFESAGGIDINYQRALRVTWGTYPDPGGGIVQANNANNTIRFQIRIIDRSPGSANAVTFEQGDFDLEFNYDNITWQPPVPVVGVQSPSSTVDFSQFYSDFLGINDEDDVSNDDCSTLTAIDPSFDPTVRWPCNNITIAFREGVPELVTFTAKRSVMITATPNVLNTTEQFSANVSIANDGPDVETGATASMDLPAGSSFVGVSPSSVTCSETGSTLTCEAGEVLVNSTADFSVQLTSVEVGQMTPFVVAVGGDLYDPDTNIDSAMDSVTFNPTADIALSTCSSDVSSVTQGNNATVNCIIDNNGPQEGTGIMLQVALPTQFTFVSSAECASVGSSIDCDIGALASGSSASISVVVNAANTGSADISATAIAGPENDSDSNNNVGSVLVAVNPRVDPPPPPRGGGSIAPGGIFVLSLWMVIFAFIKKSPIHHRWYH